MKITRKKFRMLKKYRILSAKNLFVEKNERKKNGSATAFNFSIEINVSVMSLGFGLVKNH